MYWKKTLGEDLYFKVIEYLNAKKAKMSVTMLVRLAVEKYIERG